MRRLLATTAIVTGALWFHAPTAHAVTTTLTESWVMGTPDHTNCFKSVGNGSCSFEAPTLSTGLGVTSNAGLIDPMNSGSSQTVTIGQTTANEWLFVASPGNTNNTVSTADIPVTFTLSDGVAANNTFGSVTFTAYMEYYADVKNQKDFMLWSATPFTSPSQNFINTGTTLALTETIAANGSVITMTLPYEQDWDMGQGVTFDVSVAPSVQQQAAAVPEPATITLLGLGLLGTAAVARRKRR